MAENTPNPHDGFDPEDLDEILDALEAWAARAADAEPEWWGDDADQERLLVKLDREVEAWSRRQAVHGQWTWERFGDLDDPCASGECESPALGRCCAGPRAIRRELAILEARMRVRPREALAAEIMRLRGLLSGKDVG